MTNNPTTTTRRPPSRALAVAGALVLLGGCPEARSPTSGRSVVAEKWYQRALGEYRRAAIDAARDSTRQALELAPGDVDLRLLAARVALARLELDEALRQLKALPGAAAAALRARALWYAGDVERAADGLDALLADPDVNDQWAREIGKLAHQGAGRRPFEIVVSEGHVASVEMWRVVPGQPQYLVPVEVDGDRVLGLIASGTAEVMIDSASRPEPGWVSLRFDRRLEVRDVPALPRDLSGLSHQLGAPIKVLLGASLLRHLNVTFDQRGRQFVARDFVPAPPRVASRVDVYYLRGGAMVLGASLGPDNDKRAPLLVDTTMGYSVALDRGGWQQLGIDAATLPLLERGPGPEIRNGLVPLLRLGAFAVPQVGGVYGPPFEALERELEVDLDGAVGAGLLSAFRLTLSDGGRVLWIEQLPPVPPAGPIDLTGLPMPLIEGPPGGGAQAPGGTAPGQRQQRILT
jgi:hypothetical protein